MTTTGSEVATRERNQPNVFVCQFFIVNFGLVFQLAKLLQLKILQKTRFFISFHVRPSTRSIDCVPLQSLLSGSMFHRSICS